MSRDVEQCVAVVSLHAIRDASVADDCIAGVKLSAIRAASVAAGSSCIV